ncbi:MAG: class I SAM-dependent methyltransferase [Nostoc sp. NMS1]|uniref:class I SAM-dependent methyltransferase n=1 Tax=unclassified Nostoc TaxID=2593658 RepID=UPI0025F0AFFC|nr:MULTISPECIES: class I SAM-dependent methyltransferase [unclassified Nostoc]MBN3909341.1 class I SAM-dependent methyltransferase [Nostoc sp. NMS1]MBN3993424.1 class I SAM-dependent methyltransferase [Nostoc sp. NMS2]
MKRAKKRRDWSPFWALITLIITVSVSMSKGKNATEKINAIMDQGVSILLTTLVAYTASKINFLEKTKETTDALLETAKDLSNQLNIGTENLTNTAKQISSLSHRADTAINSLEKTASELISLDSLVPDDLFTSFESGDQNKLTSQINQAFRQHKQAWIDSAKKLDLYIHPSIAYSWTNFVQICTKEGQPNNQTVEITTSPKAYTEAVTTFCKKLLDMYPDENITLFLVTAMLPEQFYNWPQMAFSDHTSPEYISHTWKGSHEYFPSMKDLSRKDKLRIRRCILVKANDYKGIDKKKLPSVETINDLRMNANLYIYKDPLKYKDFSHYKMENMFAQTAKLRFSYPGGSGLSYAPYNAGKQIIDIDNFEFYPIGTKEQFDNSINPGGRKFLLERFIQELHSNSEDSLYYTLRDTDFDKLDFLFNSELDIMPELAMFKIGSDQNWMFGISGLLTPFTESISLRFLAGKQLDPLRKTLRYLEFEADSLITLFKPELFQESFENEYKKPCTDWEELPLDYQSKFVSKEMDGCNWSEIKNILDIGCGRGYGTLTMLLNEERLNRPDVNVLGIDIASNAIEDANKLLQSIKLGETYPNLTGFPVKKNDVQLRCNIEFKQCDILDDSIQGLLSEFDLVIDWMCFHELPKADWDKYVLFLEKICKKWLVLNVFTMDEGITMYGLDPVAMYIPKHQFTQSAIREDLFRNFLYIGSLDYEEDSKPQSSGSPIAAKRAYLMRKKDS